MRLAVIGAGAFGSWIALTAVRQGFETILVERFGPAHNRSSSAGPSRIIRSAYGGDEIYTIWAQRSLALWKQFLASAGCRHLFRRTGVLWFADASNTSIHAARAIFERQGITHEFLDAGGIRARVPIMITSDSTVAIFEPDAGALLAESCVRAVVAEAIAAGAQYIVGRAEWSKDRNILLVENNGSIEADHYVFACGSWLPRIFPDISGRIIFPTAQEVFFFDGACLGTAEIPIWVDQTDSRVPYGFPNIDGAGLKLAFHRPGPLFDPDSTQRDVTSDQIHEVAVYLRERFQLSGDPVCRRAETCHYENTSSGDFLIDRHPFLSNVWFAGGGSGHGFKHAPAVGEYVIEAVRRGASLEPRFRVEAMGARLNKTVV